MVIWWASGFWQERFARSFIWNMEPIPKHSYISRKPFSNNNYNFIFDFVLILVLATLWHQEGAYRLWDHLRLAKNKNLAFDLLVRSWYSGVSLI